ncbi:TetR/AcrR family transcriptional regulator [Curtobacterium sp. NPDC090217]|uniref:TetR/AcrR family transcriptional regulator n=1 Tax=unclassified Curtobacterium TaxID=257496 RepID=UPI0007D72DE7|nr:TetR/AcrR family transcriptional regulator [Curtobacterium sp. 9128]SBN61497.1 transcriptional regulator, TetR family [Curtobacterium sp. 9128]
MTDSVRDRIVDAAADLLADVGPAGVTTRAVAAAAGVQAPTIYRQFGDKDGLLEAVADRVFAAYVAGKTVPDDVDPVEHLRDSFDAHIAFGLANPGLTALFSDPLRSHSTTEDQGIAVLRERIHRVALAGRLRVPEPRAVSLVHAIGVGVVLDLIGTPAEERDPALVAAAWDALAFAILTAAPEVDHGSHAAAVQLAADDDALAALSPSERALMRDWLARIADA